MSNSTILVIDDSTTIRKMVDSHLSQEGYRVVLAPNGEIGVELASEVQPDLILLDHQLPGTTGIEVCRKIIAKAECSHIPFVVSSTLRKQAYVEYMDVPNVVDSLPKPFTPDLLKMTVANALETGALIVSSQANGTAVPEVVGETEQPALSGDFRWLGLREVIDFLNNGQKDGMLVVETERNRVCFFLGNGRIQGVVSPSFDPAEIAARLPASMKELSPLLQFTMSSGTSTRVDGLVELMDKKMLDPRMLRTLLRHQAAVLTRYCFQNSPQNFSFLPDQTAPSLFAKAAVDSCLAAILVDGAMNDRMDNGEASSPAAAARTGWVRNTLRGQNLDRAGLSAKHVQLLTHLDATPRNSAEIGVRAGLSSAETERVLQGLLLAEWVQTTVLTPNQTLVAFEPDVPGAEVIRGVIEEPKSGWTGNVVRDEFSLQILLKRKSPDAVLVAVQGEAVLDLPEKLRDSEILNGDRRIILVVPEDASQPLAESIQHLPVLRRPYQKSNLESILNSDSMPIDVPAELIRSATATEATLAVTGVN